MLDAASRGVGTKKPNSVNKQQLPSSDSSNDGANGPEEPRTEPASPGNAAEPGPPDNRSSTNGKKKGKGGNPDPFERIEIVALSSLAGSLKILSAAVGGVGEAVFQTGTVAEELAGGAGQVAGERSEGGFYKTLNLVRFVCEIGDFVKLIFGGFVAISRSMPHVVFMCRLLPFCINAVCVFWNFWIFCFFFVYLAVCSGTIDLFVNITRPY